MQQVLVLTFPFFALVLCGFGAARSRLMPVSAIPGLNIFVLYFALPAMLFRFAAGMPIERMLDGTNFIVYLVAALAMVVVTVATTLRGAIGWNDASFGALVAAFPNTGFMGMPLLSAMLGAAVLAPVVSALTVDFVLTTSLCIALSRIKSGSGDSGSGKDAWAGVSAALRGVFANPLPWAILGGGSVSWGGVELYTPIFKIVDMLADAGSPAALFTIGAVIARSQFQAAEAGKKSAGWQDVPLVVAIKLVVHPVLVVLCGKLAIMAGAPLDNASLTTLALLAALPSATSVTMLSERYGADSGRIARVVMLSTALAFLSFSATAAFLIQGQG